MARKPKPDDLLTQPIDPPEAEAPPPAAADDPPAADTRPQTYATSNPRPVCPWHGVECQQTGTVGPLRRFKCPIAGCNYTTKITRQIARGSKRRPAG